MKENRCGVIWINRHLLRGVEEDWKKNCSQ